ncbi:MAG: hypothetical protein HYS27_06835 [Deltaproteobacteria bacterium]|nr:hypothetical protein [Deltaproteobacteria bacterium]
MRSTILFGFLALADVGCVSAPTGECGAPVPEFGSETANCVDHASLVLSLQLPDDVAIEIPGLGGTRECDTPPGSGTMTLSTDPGFGPGDVVVASIVVDEPDVFLITPGMEVPLTVAADDPVARDVRVAPGAFELTVVTSENETYRIHCAVR